MDPVEVCVVHVAADAAGRTFDATVRVLAQLGLRQVLLPLREGPLARSAQQLEVRALQWPGNVLGRIRALETELAALAGEKSFYAVHLHGPTQTFDSAAGVSDVRLGIVTLAVITASVLRVSTSGAGLSVRAASSSVGARGTMSC